MQTNWLEFAQKLAASARAGLAIERCQMERVLAEQREERKPETSSRPQ